MSPAAENARLAATVPARELDLADARRLALWRSFLKAHAGVAAALERELESAQGMPLSWYGVLAALEEAPGHRMRMQDLAGEVLLSFSGLTRLLDRIEQAGFVRRAPCSSDRRGVYAVLTTEGSRAYREAAPVHSRGVQDFFARDLDKSEVAALDSALRKIIQAAGPARNEPCGDGEGA
jgi:DNA-binding MarR family transcriptional regulator